MIPKLIVSATLVAAFVYVLSALAADASDQVRTFWSMVAVLALGHHRNLGAKGGVAWTRLTVAESDRTDVLDTLWGIPLGRPRTVRVSVNARTFAQQNPRLARFVELMPTVLRGVVRRGAGRIAGRA